MMDDRVGLRANYYAIKPRRCVPYRGDGALPRRRANVF
jgi:hypothetical protein